MVNEVGVIECVSENSHEGNRYIIEEVNIPSDKSILVMKYGSEDEELYLCQIAEALKMVSEKYYSNIVIPLPKSLSLEAVKVKDLISLCDFIEDVLECKKNEDDELSDTELIDFLEVYNRVINPV